MDKQLNILIYSEDDNQGAIIQDYVKAAGYNSEVFDQEEAAYEGFLSGNFKFCIIDHDMETKEAARTLATMIKYSVNIIPVVFLCERPTREEIALMFSTRADDMIRKPLDAEILQARIKAIQNRYWSYQQTVRIYLFGKYKFDLQKQTLSIGDKTTRLSTKEAELLTLLCQHANKMVERVYALQTIWRNCNYFSARSMDVYITKLRKLLQEDPTIKIINIHGRGYQLSTHYDGY